MKKLKCPKCGSENLRFMVDVKMSFDIKHLFKLTKAALREKTTELQLTDWRNVDVLCFECCYTMKLEDANYENDK